jgi:hypothetical protein
MKRLDSVSPYIQNKIMALSHIDYERREDIYVYKIISKISIEFVCKRYTMDRKTIGFLSNRFMQ